MLIKSNKNSLSVGDSAIGQGIFYLIQNDLPDQRIQQSLSSEFLQIVFISWIEIKTMAILLERSCKGTKNMVKLTKGPVPPRNAPADHAGVVFYGAG